MATTVILIHGYMDDSETWDGLIRELKVRLPEAAGNRFFAVSIQEVHLANAGSATVLEGYRDQALQQMGMFGAAADDDTIVVGHSMGGAVAELVALQAGDRIKAVVLVTPVPLAGAKLAPEVRARFQANIARRTRESMKSSRRALSPHLDDVALEMMVRTGSRVSALRALQQLTAWDGGHPDGEGASPVRCPVLVVTSDDPFFGRDQLEQLATRFPLGRTRHIDGAGHWSHVEKPGVLAELVHDFLSEILPATERR